MIMTETELLPCPLHNGAASLESRSQDERSGYNTTFTIRVACCSLTMTGETRRGRNGWVDDPKGKGRAALITAWNTRTATPGAVEDPQPEIVGSPLAKIISYNQAHETAVEMCYPSLTEALEHLDELRNPTPDAGLAGALDTKLADLFPEWEGDQRKLIAELLSDAVLRTPAAPVGDAIINGELALLNWQKYNGEQGDETVYQAEKLATSLRAAIRALKGQASTTGETDGQ